MGLWTEAHFKTIVPTFIIFIVLAVLIGRVLKNKSEKVKMLPLQIITVLILLLEIGKQIVSCDGGYDLYSLPFHYCSLFLYLLPLHSFYRGKYKRFFDSAAFGCLASLFLFMLVMPAVVYSEWSINSYFNIFMEFHTVTFHNLVSLYFLLTISLKLYSFDTKYDLKVMALFLAIYVVIATVLSQTLKVNFHNLYECNLAMIETVRESVVSAIGWVGQAIYVFVMFVLTIAFAYGAYFLSKFVLSIIGKIFKKKSV